MIWTVVKLHHRSITRIHYPEALFLEMNSRSDPTSESSIMIVSRHPGQIPC